MKLAVAVAPAQAPDSTFVVWRGFQESFQKAADFGYHGVELALQSAADIVPDHLAKWLANSNLEISCISTGQVYASSNLTFTHPDPDIRKKAVDVFKGLIKLSKDFGKLINVGRVRGFITNRRTAEETERLFIDTIRQLCDIAGEKDVTIAIEPINRYEINFINRLDEAASLINKINLNNIGLMPDVFHMNIEEVNIGASLTQFATLIRYVHFADSNRHAPGQGHLDFDEIFYSLKTANFNDWAAVEILPKPNPDTAAKLAAEFLLPRIDRFNRMLEPAV